MATSCPAPDTCGTTAQVWLDLSRLEGGATGDHLLGTGNVSAEACVSWGFSSWSGGYRRRRRRRRSLSDCCLFTLPVRILNCGGFNVYHLGPTQACDIAYCSAPAPAPAPAPSPSHAHAHAADVTHGENS